MLASRSFFKKSAEKCIKGYKISSCVYVCVCIKIRILKELFAQFYVLFLSGVNFYIATIHIASFSFLTKR